MKEIESLIAQHNRRLSQVWASYRTDRSIMVYEANYLDMVVFIYKEEIWVDEFGYTENHEESIYTVTIFKDGVVIASQSFYTATELVVHLADYIPTWPEKTE